MSWQESWKAMHNGFDEDRDAAVFVERHNYVDELERAFVLGICDFKKGYRFVPKNLTYEEGVEWGKGWLAMKCLTKRKEYVPPPEEQPMTSAEFETARAWRWEKFRELALAQGVDVGERL